MSGFSRRNFMQMLGLGGMALAVEASNPIPLFGSDEASPKDLALPTRDLLKGHVVVQKKGLTERIPADDPIRKKYEKWGSDVVPVARITRVQVPGGGEVRTLTPHRLFACGVDGPAEGLDPHVVYYKAAHDLRAKFAKLSRAKLESISPELRPGATLVTVVESPIMVSPRGRQGFDVVCYFRQGIRYSTSGLDTFNIYSEQGEFPIDVPSNIDMSLLMKMDREVLSDGSLLLDDPRKWRPSGRRVKLFTS